VLEELVRAVARGETSLPDSVSALIEDRVGRLDAELRRVLRAASVFGERAPADGAAHVLGARPLATIGWLDELVREEILVSSPERPGEYAFRHALFRDAVYSMIPEGERSGAHALAAGWLALQVSPNPAAMVEHWERAGQPRELLRWAVEACERAAAAGDYDGIGIQLDRIRRLDHTDDQLSRALYSQFRALTFTAQHRAALRVATEMAMLGGAARKTGLAALVTSASMLGDRAAFAFGLVGLGAAPVAFEGPVGLIACTGIAISFLFAVGVDKGRPYLAQLEEILATLEDRDRDFEGGGLRGRPYEVGAAKTVRGFYDFCGDDRADVPALLEALERMRDLRDHYAEQALLAILAAVYREGGRFEELRGVRDYLATLPTDTEWQARGSVLRQEASVRWAADPTRLLTALEELQSADAEDRHGVAIARSEQALALVDLGRYDEALEVAGEIRRTPFVMPRSVSEAAAALAEVKNGRLDEAHKALADQRALHATQGAFVWARRVLDEVELRLALRGRADARAVARRVHADLARWSGYFGDPPDFWTTSPSARRLTPLIGELDAKYPVRARRPCASYPEIEPGRAGFLLMPDASLRGRPGSVDDSSRHPVLRLGSVQTWRTILSPGARGAARRVLSELHRCGQKPWCPCLPASARGALLPHPRDRPTGCGRGYVPHSNSLRRRVVQ